ncbi:MAG TPA: hypothetical protein VLB02_03070 [Candidatus Paceibacterota bacterium]|nr:hypothetical protein [Candidatus Paceibacterota bacterium]
MTNEFVAKKIGELVAFTMVSGEILDRGGAPLLEKLGQETVLDITEKNQLHGETLRRFAEEAGVLDTVTAKTEKTAEKLRKLHEVYIGDAWQNPVEVCEWLGFFEGAAIVHWELLRGAAATINNEALLVLTEEAVTYHYELLEKFGSELEEVGQAKAAD